MLQFFQITNILFFSDLRKSKKLQGVDTPSQKRYIRALGSWLSSIDCYQDHGTLSHPPASRIKLQRLEISNFWVEPDSVKLPIVAAVHLNGAGGGKVVFISEPVWDVTQPTVNIDLKGFECGGDLRVTVFNKKEFEEGVSDGLVLVDPAAGLPTSGHMLAKRKIAGKEPGVMFYFLFHSHFLEKDGTLHVPLNMMDKAFKNKKKKYNISGVTTLYTEPGSSQA